MKDNIMYCLGIYEKEVQAAIAVNIKTKELYGLHARMNEVSEEELAEHLQSVLEKMKALDEKREKSQASSKYKGVNKTKSRWHARITHYGVEYFLGSYETEKEAALAYNKRCIELYGDKAKLNVID